MANPNPKPPGGRPKGCVNKSTANAREAIAAFVEGNVERLNGWLEQIAAKDPEKAFRCVMDVCEYHVPKLARHEQAIDPNANTINIVVKQYSPLDKK